MDAEAKQGQKAPAARPSTISTHTPGPWRFDGQDFLVRANNGNTVVDVDSGDDIEPECSANGRLIAAAPTMAEALTKLAAHPCAHPPSCGHLRFSQCRNALVDSILADTKAALAALDEGQGTAPKAPSDPTPSPKASP